jgi:erythromycin esterase-like protein
VAPIIGYLCSPSADRISAQVFIPFISFDRSYLKRVIEYHRAFLDTLERDLIPQVRSEELDALLGEVQAEFAAHLAEAEALAATLWNWTRSADICGNRRARPRLRP